MIRKKLLNTALVSMLAVTGLLTSCNSAHELMEPPVAMHGQLRSGEDLALDVKQRNGVVITTVPAGGGAVTTRKVTDNSNTKKTSETANFIVSLNKLMNLKYANMLGVLPQVITNDLLYSFIDEWYGTRYRLGGTDKKGIDCSAFVQRLYERVFNVNVLRTAAEQFSFCNAVFNKDDLKEGDLVFFHIKTKRISHVGIYLMNDYFVHSSSSSGVMISNLNDKYWQKYFAGAGRVLKNSKLKIDPGTL